MSEENELDAPPPGAAAAASAAIRILVVDDHTRFRCGLTALLARDSRLSGVAGVDALPALREAALGACILMLTVSEDEVDLAAPSATCSRRWRATR